MAVVVRLSTQMTNRDSLPRVTSNPGAVCGMLRGFAASLETVSGDSIGSTYRLAQVPSNAVMHSLRLYSDDVGTTTIADIGLYDTTENGGAVVSQALFASAVVINAGALNGTDVLYEAVTSGADISDMEKAVWQQLGLATDPKKNYDVVMTLTAAADAAATVAVKGSFAQ